MHNKYEYDVRRIDCHRSICTLAHYGMMCGVQCGSIGPNTHRKLHSIAEYILHSRNGHINAFCKWCIKHGQNLQKKKQRTFRSRKHTQKHTYTHTSLNTVRANTHKPRHAKRKRGRATSTITRSSQMCNYHVWLVLVLLTLGTAPTIPHGL